MCLVVVKTCPTAKEPSPAVPQHNMSSLISRIREVFSLFILIKRIKQDGDGQFDPIITGVAIAGTEVTGRQHAQPKWPHNMIVNAWVMEEKDFDGKMFKWVILAFFQTFEQIAGTDPVTAFFFFLPKKVNSCMKMINCVIVNWHRAGKSWLEVRIWNVVSVLTQMYWAVIEFLLA